MSIVPSRRPSSFFCLCVASFLSNYSRVASMSTASGLKRLAAFRLSPETTLCIARGSVVDFVSSSKKSAIVNAANEECLGGGGVDGAISSAGGELLLQHRLALPKQAGGVRCPTGQAVLTGPGNYGRLHVPYVIHAVGPSYFSCETPELGDALLEAAYLSSLDRASEAELEAVAFSLLSAGVFRGTRSVRQVLQIGVESIHDWASMQHDMEDAESEEDNMGSSSSSSSTSSLKDIVMCAFNQREADTLMEIASEMNLTQVQEEEEENKNEMEPKPEQESEEESSQTEPKLL